MRRKEQYVKKIFYCVISLIVLFSSMIVCYAGDIPESLLSNDNAQVYFGEIKSVDGEHITVIQRQNIKGDFTKDGEVTYAKFVFTDAPEVGKQYLCGFLDDNNPVYIWEVTSFDTNTLEIKNDDDMSKRMQEYLNNGDFVEKEQERVLGMDESSATLPLIEEDTTVPSTNIENQTPTNSSTRADDNNSTILVWIFCGCLAIGLVILFGIKRKH